MQRGEIWLGSGRGDFAGKPRPFLIIQNEKYLRTASVVVCPFSSQLIENKSYRPIFQPTPSNGLLLSSQLLIDVTTSYAVSRFSHAIGCLNANEIVVVDAVLADFLGLFRLPELAMA